MDLGRILDSVDRGLDSFFGYKAAQAQTAPPYYDPYWPPQGQAGSVQGWPTSSARPEWLMPVLLAAAGVGLVFALRR
ncbi:hypothetical protein [Arenibaculum sp.]|jgi:hypothetical protein|uniref:hypothetical protein n=1 Tax=Arenibaculum sp. TaxID=2865862 RepID=UPI002E11729E|nr:hypothetical protein [Arenibaculum sp.]